MTIQQTSFYRSTQQGLLRLKLHILAHDYSYSPNLLSIQLDRNPVACQTT
jgi:hypothetical protein